MKCVDFNDIEPQETFGHTSKGNQLKWLYHNYWYKADHMGYEGLAEAIISELLGKSTIRFPYVQYNYTHILYHGRNFNGCMSADFTAGNSSLKLIPLEKLYRSYTGGSLAIDTARQRELKNQIKFLVDFVERNTGLQNFGAYLTTMLEIDAFFLNEDRHTNNIAVLYNEETDGYDLCPLFDNGLALLADIALDFPLERPIEDCLKAVEAKPFSRRFDDQLDAAEELYGIQIHFRFTGNDVKALIDSHREIYGDEICNRCESVIRRQMQHYSYLMKP